MTVILLLTYLLTYLLTPWCRVLPEQLTGLQLVKKFPAFHGTRRFITAHTTVRHLSLSCVILLALWYIEISTQSWTAFKYWKTARSRWILNWYTYDLYCIYIYIYFDVLLTVHLSIFISLFNQLDAQNLFHKWVLFHASTWFEHMCSSSGVQNCITQPLVSSHV